MAGVLTPCRAVKQSHRPVGRVNNAHVVLSGGTLRTVRTITVPFSRSGSRQDFRNEQVPKLLASFATTVILASSATIVIDRVILCFLLLAGAAKTGDERNQWHEQRDHDETDRDPKEHNQQRLDQLR